MPRRIYTEVPIAYNTFTSTEPIQKLTKHLLVPCVRLTSVLPTSRFVNMHGARTLYQSLRVNGSMLKTINKMTKLKKNDRSQEHSGTR